MIGQPEKSKSRAAGGRRGEKPEGRRSIGPVVKYNAQDEEDAGETQ